MNQPTPRAEPQLGDFLNAHAEVETGEFTHTDLPRFTSKDTQKANVFGFSGRLSVSRFWMYYLIYAFWIPIVGVTLYFKFLSFTQPNQVFFSLLLFVYITGLTIGLYLRRVKDIGHSLYWLLLTFVPIVSALFVIYLCTRPGQPEPNRFGLPDQPLAKPTQIGLAILWIGSLALILVLGEYVTAWAGIENIDFSAT